jgi:hypothetical protein
MKVAVVMTVGSVMTWCPVSVPAGVAALPVAILQSDLVRGIVR